LQNSLQLCRVLANVLFPNWLVTVLLLGLLLFLTYKTGKKAVSLHRCEVRYLAQREEQRAARGVRLSDQASTESPAPARPGERHICLDTARVPLCLLKPSAALDLEVVPSAGHCVTLQNHKVIIYDRGLLCSTVALMETRYCLHVEGPESQAVFAGAVGAKKKPFVSASSRVSARPAPSELAIQAAIDEATKKALALSAAGQLGSTGGQSTPGSTKIGDWQEARDGAGGEKARALSP
jgi:hypothetical protein